MPSRNDPGSCQNGNGSTFGYTRMSASRGMRAIVENNPNGSPERSTIGPRWKRPRRSAGTLTFQRRTAPRPAIDSTRPVSGSGQFEVSLTSTHSFASRWSFRSS